jgi:hypothetical protein
MKCFAHSGDLGDLLYALPTIKALGGGEVILYPDKRVREAFTVERAHNIGVLLAEQSYIRRWRFVPGAEERRRRLRLRALAERIRPPERGKPRLFAGSRVRRRPCRRDVPWLEVEHPATLARVVVIRSHRYRQHDFPWLELARRYRKEAVVLGAQSEFEELFHLYGFEKHVQTLTLAEMARVIAGAELVITNQTAAYAIAEGLKKR